MADPNVLAPNGVGGLPQNLPSYWDNASDFAGRTYTYVKSGVVATGNRISRTLADRGDFFNVTKIGGKALVLFKCAGYVLPVKMQNTFGIFMDYNDATRGPDNFFYLFTSRTYSKEKPVEEGLAIDWNNRCFGKALGKITLAVADTMSTIGLLNYMKVINTAQIAQSLGGFRILGVAVFGVVKKVALETVARGTVIVAMVLFTGQAIKNAHTGWNLYASNNATDQAKGKQKLKESAVEFTGALAESASQILWFANVSSGTGTVVICLFTIVSAGASIIRNQM